MTDQYSAYQRPARAFASHEAVNHSVEEWVCGNAHTNTIEGYFSSAISQKPQDYHV